MMIVYLPVLPLVILVLYTLTESCGATKFLLKKEPLSFNDAKKRCQSEGGDLVDFRDDLSKTNARILMENENIDKIWLNTKQTLNPWIWINDCELIRDQGCYLDKAKNAALAYKRGDIPDMATYSDMSALRRNECQNVCTDYTFFSLQMGTRGTSTELEFLCGCGESYGRYNNILLDHCPTKCPTNEAADKYCVESSHFASVFAVGGTPYPEWRENWHNERAKHTSCGTFVKESTQEASAFKIKMCHLNAFPLCEVRASFEGSFHMERSNMWLRPMFHHIGTWENARKVCQGLHPGADLVKVNTKKRVDDLIENLDGTGTYWIGAIKYSWPWLNEETKCAKTSIQWPSDLKENCLRFKYAKDSNEERLIEECDSVTSSYVCKIPDVPVYPPYSSSTPAPVSTPSTPAGPDSGSKQLTTEATASIASGVIDGRNIASALVMEAIVLYVFTREMNRIL